MTEYIAENTAKWEQDRIEREQERNQALHEWERKNRHEKIAVLKEKWKKNKLNEGKGEEPSEYHQREQERWKIWRKKDTTETQSKTRETKPQITPSSPHTPSPPPPIPSVNIKSPLPGLIQRVKPDHNSQKYEGTGKELPPV